MRDYRSEYSEIWSTHPTAGELFESTVRTVYETILSPGDVAVDVGAHVGKHTLPMARLVAPEGKIIAFEPIPEKFDKLKDAVEDLNSIVELHNICIG